MWFWCARVCRVNLLRLKPLQSSVLLTSCSRRVILMTFCCKSGDLAICSSSMTSMRCRQAQKAVHTQKVEIKLYVNTKQPWMKHVKDVLPSYACLRRCHLSPFCQSPVTFPFRSHVPQRWNHLHGHGGRRRVSVAEAGPPEPQITFHWNFLLDLYCYFPLMVFRF